MKLFKKIILTVAACVAAVGASATETSTLLKRVQTGSTIRPGYWHKNFTAAKKYADDHGIPFVAVWSNEEACPHCVRFENCVNQSYFKNWEVNSGIVFWFGCPGNGYRIDNPEYPFQWARGNEDRQKYTDGAVNKNFPFVRVWWKKGKVDIVRKGDDTHGGYDVYKATGAKKLVANLKKWLKAYNPAVYNGGSFNFKNVEGDRLELEDGFTTNVVIDLVRTNSAGAATASTNYVVVASGAGAETNRIDWAGGVKAMQLSIPVDKDGEGDYTLTLYNSAMKKLETSAITRVTTENSPSNPKFGNEGEDLGFGEWTMDLDAVTNLVVKTNAGGGGLQSSSVPDKARALVLFGGSTWCRDCANSDKNFFMQPEFKEWAVANKVALGVVDIPDFPNETTSPCLLTKVSVANDKAKDYYAVTGLARSSGLAYLSRHMVGDDAAKAVYDRNKKLATKSTVNGGWNRPEAPNANRPNVPTLVLLREDGTIAGRFKTFAFTSPKSTADKEQYFKRLNELLEMDVSEEEETNDDFRTTELQIGKKSTVSGSVSHCDSKDSYKLDDETKGLRMAATLTGASDAKVKLQVIRTSGSESKVVTSATGSLSTGVAIDAVDIPANASCYIEVVTADTNFFGAVSANSTIAGYTLSTGFVVVPAQTKTTIDVTDSNVLVQTVAGEKYTLSGVAETSLNSYFEVAPEKTSADETLYVARESGIVQLTMKEGVTELTHQRWVPGKVGFMLSSSTVSEGIGTFYIDVVRTDGLSGRASATVVFDSMKPEGIGADTIFTNAWGAAEGGIELEWEENENDIRRLPIGLIDNDFADSTVHLVFKATTSGDAAPDKTTFTLAIKDNDKAVPGKLAISDGEPSFAKTMTVIAKENSDVAFKVVRNEGADGKFAATLSASAGTLSETVLAWENRDKGKRDVTLTLPSAAAASKAVVKLAADDSDTKLDKDAKKLTVEIVPASAPEFEVAARTIVGYKYIELPETRIKAIGSAPEAALKVEKYSGTLPAGVTWKFDSEENELVMSGVPTKVGTSTAVFRVKEGSQSGLTVSVTVGVSDPTKEGSDTAGGSLAGNAFVAKERNFPNIIVLDPATNRLAGLVNLSVPASGKASAKYRSADGTIALASKSWDKMTDTESGVFVAVLKGTTADTAGYSMKYILHPDGDAYLSFTGPNDEIILDEEELGEDWTKDDPATAYKGYYNVSLPGVGSICEKNATAVCGEDDKPAALGDAYVTLKMNDAASVNVGRFTYAGILPNGKAFSGTSEIDGYWDSQLDDDTWGVVPVLSVSTTDKFAGCFKIKSNSGLWVRSVFPFEDAVPYWSHEESPLAEEYDADVLEGATASYSVELDAFGGLYVSTSNIVEIYKAAFDTKLMPSLFAIGDGLVGTKYGEFTSWSTNTTGVTLKYDTKTKTNTMTLKKSSNSYGLTLSYAAATGVVSGKFKLPMADDDGKKTVSVTYKAIMLPGWGTSDCASCTMTGDEVKRPFVSGAAWFDDDASFFVPSNGRSGKKKITIRRSCPVSIGLLKGE